MKNTFAALLILLSLLLSFACKTTAQNIFFTDVKESSFKIQNQQRVIIPQKYRTVLLDTAAFKNFLFAFSSNKNLAARAAAQVITIPLPNGTSSRFSIWQTSVMEPALAAKYPAIKTFTGQGIDDRAAIIKLDWTPLGFHAMVLSAVTGAFFIDPYTQGTTTNYITYFKSDFISSQSITENDIVKSSMAARPQNIAGATVCVGSQLLTYRLAIACTDQYAVAATGSPSPTVAATLAAIVTSINRVNGIYESELSISLVLVANEDAIIFTTPASDPTFHSDNDDAGDLINESQSVIDANIGSANYDVGETFSTGAGGYSAIGVVCLQGSKANSVVGVSNPVGDPFNVDYVSHEIGHEFGAHHPFNSNMGFCARDGQQNPGTNDEPGSGSTIMAYAGNDGPNGNGILCGSDNLQDNSDPVFNGINFSEIVNFVADGGSCASVTSTGNHAPVVDAGADYTIPVSTPFALTGSATDQDGDALTYSWEEVDVNGRFCAWNAPVTSFFGDAPLFRSFLPVSSPTRYFPKLSDVISNTTTIGEIMPRYTRTMHFRLTVRDNHAGGSGVCYAENTVTTDAASGPFIVTYPDTTNIIWNVNEIRTVTWNPAGTQASPVNCSNVMIMLSTDGGLTYPDTLLASVPNTGSAQIKVPDDLTSTARVRVTAIGNVFYDASNNDFAIQNGTVTNPGGATDWIVYMAPGIANLESNITDADVHINLFDASGRKMMETEIENVIPGQVTPISLIGFARGVYVLQMVSASHGTQHKQIVAR